MTSPADPEANPWTRRARRVAYDNPWITVYHDDVVRPDGEPGIYGFVHYKNRAVAVVPIDDDGHVLLVGQYRYTLDKYSWEVPEGGAAPGEKEGHRRDILAGRARQQASRLLAVQQPGGLGGRAGDDSPTLGHRRPSDL